jgi:hypothetical protein
VLSRASGAGMGEAASSLSLSVFGGSSQGQARQPSTRGRWPARAPPPPLSLVDQGKGRPDCMSTRLAEEDFFIRQMWADLS